MHLGIGLHQGVYQRQSCAQRLTHSQKMQLKQMLRLLQTLREPEFPDAVRGLEGMLIADTFLKDRESVGVLIGGLSEAVWNKNRKPQELAQHKDVDVLVLDYMPLEKRFQWGIDWWLPYEAILELKGDTARVENYEQKFWCNGNGCALSFGVSKIQSLASGLYIPSFEWVKQMREYEAQANTDTTKVDIIDWDSIYERLKKELEKTIKTSVPKFVEQKFKNQILDDKYQKDPNTPYAAHAIELTPFNIEQVRAINKYLGREEQK